MDEEQGRSGTNLKPTYDGSMYLVGYAVVAAFGVAAAVAFAAIA